MGSIRKSEYLTVSLCLLLNKFDVKFDECYHKKLSYFYNKEVMVSEAKRCNLLLLFNKCQIWNVGSCRFNCNVEAANFNCILSRCISNKIIKTVFFTFYERT